MGIQSVCDGCGCKPSTVCEEGCAMSCVSMALAGHGVTVNTQGANPGNLNAWLRSTSGYLCLGGDCNNLVLNAPNMLSDNGINVTFISEDEKPDLQSLQQMVMDDVVCIAHVRNKTHFVLLTGWNTTTPTSFTVNDPGFPEVSYDYSEMADIILYTMKSVGARSNLTSRRQPQREVPATAVGRLSEAKMYDRDIFSKYSATF